MKEILPESILRRKKQGFGPPLSYWLKTELKTLLFDTLNHNARCWDIFDRKFAYQIIDTFYSNQLVEPHKLWSILLFELWLRKFRVSI